MEAETDISYTIERLNFCHSIAVGMFNYKRTSNIWWRLWSLYYMIAMISVISANISYLIMEELKLQDSIVLVTTLATSVSIFTLQHICYKFCENWTNLKKVLEKDFVASLNVDGELQQTERLKNLRPLLRSKFRPFVLLYPCISLVMIFGSFLWLCTQQHIDFHHKLNYLYPFPGILRVNDRASFLFINFHQAVSLAGFSLIIPFTWILLITIVVEITNKAVVLEERMKLFTNQVHHTVAMVRENELKLDDMPGLPQWRKLIERRSQNDKKICFQKFDENLKLCINHHQTLLGAIKFLRPLLNDYFTITLSISVLLTIVAGFTIILSKNVDFDIAYLIRCSMVLSTLMIQMGSQCLVGQHFQNINDKIAETVYSLPWYELPPVYRKNVYIFLCQAQAPVRFYAFKTFHISTYFYPTIVNFVYTYTVNLLTIKAKFHHT